MLSDPEAFLEGLGRRRVVLDEIHRLDNPSELLKIAADHFKQVQILATGSSVLGSTAKFRDTLAGRKTQIWLTPMILQDLVDFENPDLNARLLKGGLPPFFVTQEPSESEMQEWMDAYWAKDIQELFRLERRHSFQRFVELLFAQSGGIFEATRFAGPCEISRTSVSNYLSVLEATFVAHIVRPFSSRRGTEIISAPKVYAFDTGFVNYHRGWQQLRHEDMGYLWEHFVLNELQAHLQSHNIQYWRDKRGHEIDFVLSRRKGKPIAIECKWSADEYQFSNLESYRLHYPNGENFVVCQDVIRTFHKRAGNLEIKFVSLPALLAEVV
jgi:uncharacterized protein